MFSNSSYVEAVINRRPFGWNYTEESKLGLDHFKFEEVDPFYWVHLAETRWYYGFYAGFIYLVTIYGIQWIMKDRPAFELRGPLFLWNASLGAFSIFGFVRTVPNFLYVLEQPNGVYKSLCHKTDCDIAVGCWILLFVLSKYVELGDTVFIVLRKRPLIFLQWYHHVITMLACWLTSPFMEPVARWYVVLNYGVHSFMYPYFALRAAGIRVPNFIANLITTMQFSQMIVGLFANGLSMYYTLAGYDCERDPFSMKAFSVVYGSFFVLFGKLFYDSVINNGRARKSQHKKID